MLTEEQQNQRRGKMTGSRIAPLMTGDVEGIMRLYREMTDQATEADVKYWEDVNRSLPVRIGEITEPLNLSLAEEYTGCEIVRRGQVVSHHDIPHFACTLDGFVADATPAYAVEAKHVGGRESIQTIVDRYQPQVQWTMFVTGVEMALLTVIMGMERHVIEWIDRCDTYIAEEAVRAEQFMDCVKRRAPPIDIPTPVPPPPRSRHYNMASSNAWAVLASDWIQARPEAEKFERAAKELKELVPADAKYCFGHGIEVSINKRGAKSIKLLEEVE